MRKTFTFSTSLVGRKKHTKYVLLALIEFLRHA